MAESYSVEAYLRATGTDKFSNAFKNATKNVQDLEQNTSQAGLTIGKLLATVGITAAVAKGFQLIKNSVQGAFSRIDTMEQFHRVMTTMTGSSAKAQQVLDTVNETVKGTAYGLDVAAKATQDFVTSNMDVNKATETVAAWGDAVAFYGDGSNETFASVSDALAKMTAKGKVQMDTMNRLTEAGIPAMQIYADATNQSVEDVADAMQRGELDAEKFTNVMNDALANGTENFEGIAGAAKEAGASWGASFDNMQAAVTRGVVKVIQAIDEMLTSNGLPDMRAMVAAFGAQFESMLNKVAEAIPAIVAQLKQVYKSIQPWIPLIGAVTAAVVGMMVAWSTFNTVKNIINGVKASFAALNLVMAANPWLLIVGAIIATVALIYVYWEPIKDFFVNLWDSIVQGAMNIWDAILARWGTQIEFLKQIVLGIVDHYVTVWTSIYEFTIPIIQAIVDFVMSIWSTLVDWWGSSQDGFLVKAVTLWNGVKEAVSTAITGVVDFVMGIWGGLVDWWSAHGEMILAAAQNVWTVISAVISAVVVSIQFIIVSAMNIILGIVEFVWPIILTIITFVVDAIWAIMQFVWPFIQFLIVDTWNAIVNTIQGAINIILGIVQFFAALFTGNWGEMWEATKQIFMGALQLVWGLINLWFVGKILKGVKMFGQLFGNIIKSAWNVVRGLFTSGVNVAKNVVTTGFNFIRSIISSVMNVIRSIISSVWNAIRSVISSVVNVIRSVIISAFNAYRSVVTSVMNTIRSIITSVWNAVRSVVTSVTNSIRSTISSVFNSLRGIVSGAMNGVRSAVSSGIRGALNVIKNMASSFFNAGKNIVTSIANGIKGAIGSVTGAIGEVASKVRNFLPFSPAKEGPLRDIHRLNFAGPITDSIKRGKSLIQRSLMDLLAVPDIDISGTLDNINSQTRSQLHQTLDNNVHVQRQPIVINIYDNKEAVRAYVNEENAFDVDVRRL